MVLRLRLGLAAVTLLGTLVFSSPAFARGANLAFTGGSTAQRTQMTRALAASSFDWSLLPGRVTEVRAVGVPVLTEKVDLTKVRLELENGAVANLTASRVSQERVRKIRFFSSQSYISVDTKEQEVKGYRLANRSIQPIEVTVEKKEPLRAELEAFLRCVRDRSRPLVDGADGVAAVDLATRVSAAIDESLRRYHR